MLCAESCDGGSEDAKNFALTVGRETVQIAPQRYSYTISMILKPADPKNGNFQAVQSKRDLPIGLAKATICGKYMLETS
jgi:hypothetical protein